MFLMIALSCQEKIKWICSVNKEGKEYILIFLIKILHNVKEKGLLCVYIILHYI